MKIGWMVFRSLDMLGLAYCPSCLRKRLAFCWGRECWPVDIVLGEHCRFCKGYRVR